MIPRTPRSTRPGPPFPSPTPFRSMSASAARAPLGPTQLAPATIAKAMALRNMPLPPELMSARQRQGKGGKPAPVDALGYRRLGADLPVGDVAEVLRRHLDPLPGCEDDPVAPGGLETVEIGRAHV